MTEHREPDEMAQRFIELVMMQAQQAALFLGQAPNPETGRAEVNLDYARLFIDQLEMLQEKTKGNLSPEETRLLGGVLSELRMAFVQAANQSPASQSAPRVEPPREAEPAPAAAPATADSPEPESRKRFSKSYGS